MCMEGNSRLVFCVHAHQSCSCPLVFQEKGTEHFSLLIRVCLCEWTLKAKVHMVQNVECGLCEFSFAGLKIRCGEELIWTETMLRVEKCFNT